MKTLLLVVFFSLPFQDLQKQSQVSVSRYLKNSLEDPSMYTPGKWGTVEKFMTKFEMTASYQFSFQLIKEQKDMVEKYMADDRERAKETIEDAQTDLNKLLEEKKKYKPKQFGWKIYHEYKAPNRLGNIMSYGRVFYMDKQFKIVNPDTLMIASN